MTVGLAMPTLKALPGCAPTVNNAVFTSVIGEVDLTFSL